MFSIAELGSERLEKVLVKDKTENPEKICDMLKSDILRLLNNYMETEGMEIDFSVDGEGYRFNIEIIANRIKMFGIVPK